MWEKQARHTGVQAAGLPGADRTGSRRGAADRGCDQVGVLDPLESEMSSTKQKSCGRQRQLNRWRSVRWQPVVLDGFNFGEIWQACVAFQRAARSSALSVHQER